MKIFEMIYQTKTKTMKQISLFLTLSLVLILSSCRTRTTNNALKRGEKLKSSINSFEKNRKKLSTKVVSSLQEAKESLTAENPDLPEVSKDFEKQWRSIMKRYNKMKGNFEDIGTNSRKYFEELDKLSSNIHNEKLRNEELAKNKQLETKWQKIYKEAEVSVNKVTGVLESGNDFHMVLVASSIRQKLEQNVAELTNIAEQAKALLSELEVFTQQGRELVEG